MVLRMVEGPGKFEGELELTRILWDLTLAGWGDDEVGAEGSGNYILLKFFAYDLVNGIALPRILTDLRDYGVDLTPEEEALLNSHAGVILHESAGNDGFVFGDYYETGEELSSTWSHLETVFASAARH